MITQDYFHYLHQVLGIESVLFPQTPQLLISDCLFVTNEQGFVDVEMQLYEKMVAAMRLNPSSYELIQFSTRQLNDVIEKIQNAKIVLCFDQKVFQYLQVQCPHQNFFLLPHPRQMIQDASLKKVAWEEMKKAQTFLA